MLSEANPALPQKNLEGHLELDIRVPILLKQYTWHRLWMLR